MTLPDISKQSQQWFRMIAAGLSPREAQILEMWLSGVAQKEIAYQLNLGNQTVNSHKTSLMRKLEVSDNVALVLKCVRSGFTTVSVE